MFTNTAPVVDTAVGKPAEDAKPDSEVEADAVKPDGETTETKKPEAVADSSPDTDGDSDKDSKGVQKRIDELTALRREAERERDSALKREQDYLELLKKQAEPEKTEPPKTLSDFEYDETKYRDYLFAQAEKRAVEAARTETARIQGDRISQLRKSSFQERELEFAKANKDYFEKTRSASMPFTEAMVDAIDDPEVAYYLANNPERASVIARLDPIGAAKEIAKIEGRLEVEREKLSKPAVSKAPPPAPKIEGADPGNVEKDPSQMTDTQFARWRRKQIANR